MYPKPTPFSETRLASIEVNSKTTPTLISYTIVRGLLIYRKKDHQLSQPGTSLEASQTSGREIRRQQRPSQTRVTLLTKTLVIAKCAKSQLTQPPWNNHTQVLTHSYRIHTKAFKTLLKQLNRSDHRYNKSTRCCK